MERIAFPDLTLEILRRLVDLRELDDGNGVWQSVTEEALAAVVLSDRELLQLEIVRSYLINEKLHLLNEATLWARAIYPMLIIAEQKNVRIWSEVALSASFAQFELDGIADGALVWSVAGRLEVPYLVIVETKRGIENQNPLFQLYGQLLAAARLNWERDGLEVQEVFGCYTIADSWTFVRAEVMAIESDRPILQVQSSREFSEKSDGEMILKILKRIVAGRLEMIGS